MSARARQSRLPVPDLEAILAVTSKLAATFDLMTMLADDRFITAFIGLLDPATHRPRFHSGGQAPILHFQAASGTCTRYNPTSFPLAAMPLTTLCPAIAVDLMPGDILVLLSDGICEHPDRHNELFGEDRFEAVLRVHHGRRMSELSGILLDAVQAFAQGAPQEDDITLVLVKREAGA